MIIRNLSLILLLSLSTQAFSDEYDSERTVSLDTGYIPALATNHSFWSFGLEFEHLGSLIFDKVGESTFLGSNFFTRALWGAGMYLGWGYPQYSYFVSNHEFGHGMRSQALGLSPVYVWNNDTGSHNLIFTFFFSGFFKYGSGAYTATGAGSTAFAVPANWGTAITAGGVNNSSMFAEYLEDEIYYNVGHINHYHAYLRSKLDTYDYTTITENGQFQSPTGGSGDIATILQTYSARGYGIGTNDLKMGSLIAFLASSSNWAYGISFMRYLIEGDPNVRPLALGALKLPDFSFFLNDRGISYKLRSGFDFKNFMIPFAVEIVTKGDQAVEVSLGYRKPYAITSKRKGALLVEALVNSVGGFGANAQSELKLSSSTFLSLGAGLMSAKSLRGERTISRLLSSDFGLDTWLKFSWAY